MVMVMALCVFGTQDLKDLKETLSSLDGLKHQYWNSNYGIDISSVNPLVKNTLLEINEDIMRQTLQVIEKYRVKNPTESLFQFKKNNITGSYYVLQNTPKINISNECNIKIHVYEKQNKVDNSNNEITRKQDLKLLVIQTRNIISRQIIKFNIEVINVISRINAKYNDSIKSSYWCYLFGCHSEVIKTKNYQKLTEIKDKYKKVLIDIISIHKTFKELYLLVSSDIKKSPYISSNFQILGIMGSNELYMKTKKLMEYYDKAGAILSSKISSLMEDQIDSLQGSIIRDLGRDLNKRGVPKLIGLGDIVGLGSMLFADTEKVASLLENDLEILSDSEFKLAVEFERTIDYLKNIKINTGELKKYIANSQSFNKKYKYLLPSGESKETEDLDPDIDWNKVKLQRKVGSDFEPLGFDIELYNDQAQVSINQNKEIVGNIRQIILTKLPSLRNHHTLRNKIKEFKIVYDEKVNELNNTIIMQIMKTIEEIRDSYFEFNDVFEVALRELSGMIKGIEKASPNEIYKQLLKIAVIKDLSVDDLEAVDIILAANAIAKNIFESQNLINKFRETIKTIEKQIISGTSMTYDILTKKILNNPKVRTYIIENGLDIDNLDIESILLLGLRDDIKITNLFDIIKLYIKYFDSMVNNKHTLDVVMDDLKLELREHIINLNLHMKELKSLVIDNDNYVSLGAITGATIFSVSVAKVGAPIAIFGGLPGAGALAATTFASGVIGGIVGGIGGYIVS